MAVKRRSSATPTAFRTLKYNLDENSENYAKIEELFNFLESEFHAVLKEFRDSGIKYSKDILESNNRFRDAFLEDFGYRHKEWRIPGSKLRYYRIVISLIRRALLSDYKRDVIIETCQKYDFSKERLDSIREELTKNGLYPTNGWILNILRSGGKVEKNENPGFMLDFTSGDSRISKVDVEKDRITYKVRVFDEWLEFAVDRPAYVPQFEYKVARPVFQRDTNGKLYLRVSYEIPVKTFVETENVIMGVDLGKIKPFSASINFGDSYSTELSPTKETEIVAHKIAILEKERNFLYDKIRRCNEVWDGKSEYLGNKIDRLNSERRFVVEKLAKLRKHLSWLIARDLLYHCQKNGVDTVKLENLSWLESRGGSWNFSQTQEKIHKVLSAHGIRVYVVNARNSSHTDPFTDEPISHDSNRMAETAVGKRDRDYLAGLELTKRKGRKYRRKDKFRKSAPAVKMPKKCRDKHAPTPKRAKPTKKTTIHKLKVKNNEKTAVNSGSEHYITVGALGRDSTAPCNLKSRTSSVTKPYGSSTDYDSS